MKNHARTFVDTENRPLDTTDQAVPPNTQSRSVSGQNSLSSTTQGDKDSGRKKTNRGCIIVGILGCALIIVLIGVIVAVMVVLVAASSGMSESVTESTLYSGGRGKIAMISIDGVIVGSSDAGVFSAVGTTPERISSELNKALADESVKGILIKMDSPGGEVVASDLILTSIIEAKEKKPVVTWMGGMGASGGYLIALGSDMIVAHPGTITGSIGVILEVTNLQGLYDKLGIQSRVFKSGEFKDQSGLFDDDPDGEADRIIQGIVDEAYEDFVAIVSTQREMDSDVARELSDGRVYTGRQAYELGLIDEVGGMDDAISVLEGLVGESDLTIIEYTMSGFWSSFYRLEQLLVEKLGMIAGKDSVGVRSYYLLDI